MRSMQRRGTGVAQHAGTAACATGVCVACTHEDGSACLLTIIVQLPQLAIMTLNLALNYVY